MRIVNTYEETLSHYNRKLNHAEEELEDALRGLRELEGLASGGWQGRAAEAFLDETAQLQLDMAEPKKEIEEIRRVLAGLGAAIEEEIRLLMEEEERMRNASLS